MREGNNTKLPELYPVQSPHLQNRQVLLAELQEGSHRRNIMLMDFTLKQD